MPAATFRALQETLEHIASTMGSVRPEGEDSRSELSATVEGLTVIYQRDDALRTLTLVDILQDSIGPAGR